MALNSPADVERTDDVATLITAGLAAAERQDKTTARAALRKAARLDPDNAAAWLGVAQVVGTFSERRQAYERALELDPDNAEARSGLDALLSGEVNPHGSKKPVKPELPPLDPMATHAPTEITVCYRHPNRETGLHCIQCSRPICSDCAYPTPVGYICPECRKARRSPLYQVEAADVIKTAIVGVIAGALGGFLSSLIGGGFFFIFFILAFAGAAIGEGVMRVITWATRKRGPIIQATAAIAILVGAGIVYVALGFRINFLTLAIFLGLAIATIYQRLK